MSSKNFTTLQKVGTGVYSQVFKVVRKQDQRTYAMKVVSYKALRDLKQQQNALNQIRLLSSIKSKYIIRYRQAFFQNECLYLIMDFAKEGDLFHKIKKQYRQNQVYAPQSQVWKAVVHLLRGLNVLHSNGICHRDIKSHNVFIGCKGQYILGDFNVSKLINDELMRTQTGTPYYVSPQIWKNQLYTNKSDMWSFGCLIYEMCAFVPPFIAVDLQELRQKAIKGVFKRIPAFYSNDLQELISSLLNSNPRMRKTPAEMLSSQLLKSKIQKYKLGQEDEGKHTMKLADTLRVEEGVAINFPKSSYDQRSKSLSTRERPSRPQMQITFGIDKPISIKNSYDIRTDRTKRSSSSIIKRSPPHSSKKPTSLLKRMLQQDKRKQLTSMQKRTIKESKDLSSKLKLYRQKSAPRLTQPRQCREQRRQLKNSNNSLFSKIRTDTSLSPIKYKIRQLHKEERAKLLIKPADKAKHYFNKYVK